MKLTKRERQVALLMIWENVDLAKALNVTTHTVKVHIHNILRKTGAINRRQALVFLLQKGLLNLFDIDTQIKDAGFWNEHGVYEERFITYGANERQRNFNR